MRTPIDKIEIQEPPINKLKKGRSCLRQSCGMSCGCLVVLIVGLLFLFNITSDAPEKELGSLPAHFPANIPVYDPDSIERIAISSHTKTQKNLRSVLRLPRSLVRRMMSGLLEDTERPRGRIWLDTILDEPEPEIRDRITIEWKNFDALPDFVWEFYTTELSKVGFAIEVTAETDQKKQMRFASDRIEGSFFLTDDASRPGTDRLSLTLLLPPRRAP